MKSAQMAISICGRVQLPVGTQCHLVASDHPSPLMVARQRLCVLRRQPPLFLRIRNAISSSIFGLCLIGQLAMSICVWSPLSSMVFFPFFLDKQSEGSTLCTAQRPALVLCTSSSVPSSSHYTSPAIHTTIASPSPWAVWRNKQPSPQPCAAFRSLVSLSHRNLGWRDSSHPDGRVDIAASCAALTSCAQNRRTLIAFN